jgi:hypothetical protein
MRMPRPKHMQEWQRVILQYPCTYCGAAPGEWCTTDTGHLKPEPHADRSYAASEHGWKLAPENRPADGR